MPRRKSKKSDHENLDRWLLTYADLITLLLAFFIVMYSMSRVDAKKFGKMAEALNGVLKGGQSLINKENGSTNTKGHGLLKLGDLNQIQVKINERFKTLGKNEQVQTEITERGLVVHIMESALFDEGSADLRGKTTDILDVIYNEIVHRPNHIRIEGHTDNRKIHSSIYPTNWELSTARATAVVRYFIDNYHMNPAKLSALGYGEYRPIRPNNTIENRAKNRRVDVVILTMELSLKEPTSQLYDFAQNQVKSSNLSGN